MKELNFEQIHNEKEKQPKYKIVFTRHAERLPSGELTREGREKAKKRGKQWSTEAEVVKAYSSDDPSRRAYFTGDIISAESGSFSDLTGQQYKTQERPDLEYSVFNPDLKHLLREGKDLIEESTLREVGLPVEKDENGRLKKTTADLSKEEQERVAPIRQKNQKLAFDYVLSKKEGSHRLAMCLGHQLLDQIKILNRYRNYRDKKDLSPEKDVILNNNGHGVFAEALFQEAGAILKKGEIKRGVNFNDSEIGGYLEPLDSFEFEIEDPNNISDFIPVKIIRSDSSQVGGLYLDYNKLKELDRDYGEWKKSVDKEKTDDKSSI